MGEPKQLVSELGCLAPSPYSPVLAPGVWWKRSPFSAWAGPFDAELAAEIEAGMGEGEKLVRVE